MSFPTNAGAAPLTLPSIDVTNRSVWGNGAGQKPTVQKTGTGLYTITYSSTFTDALSTVETVAFFAGHVSCMSANSGDILTARTLTVAANVVTIGVYASGALADVGNVSAAVFPVTVWLL